MQLTSDIFCRKIAFSTPMWPIVSTRNAILWNLNTNWLLFSQSEKHPEWEECHLKLKMQQSNFSRVSVKCWKLMIHWQCWDKIGPLSVDMFWQPHYDVSLLGDYTVCILQHQTLCSEDINKMQQASSWNSYTEVSLALFKSLWGPISYLVITECLSSASEIKSCTDKKYMYFIQTAVLNLGSNIFGPNTPLEN